MQDLNEFLADLLDQYFAFHIFRLLLSYFSNAKIFQLLVREVKKRPESFGYFMEAQGFLSLNEVLSSSPSSAPSVMKLLAALAQFSPHAEIDNWINAHPITSPIFNCRSDFLAQVTIEFSSTGYLIHVPSLLPFCSNFDASSPLNLYLVGKFGVSACLSRNRSLLDVPHISLIANRYIEPGTARELFVLNTLEICKFIDLGMPQLSLYEFAP
jgi:hypothetical protein